MGQQKFAVIYEKLKKDISEGIYLHGEQLPSERELVETYHSSRETVRKALELLANDGMIQKIKGKGSIVIQQDITEFPFSDLISFKEVKEKLPKLKATNSDFFLDWETTFLSFHSE